MSRKAFHLLLKKYLDGRCSQQEKELVDQWYELLDDESLLSKKEDHLSFVEDRIWQKIQDNIHLSSSKIKKKKALLSAIPVVYKWVAAVLVIVAGAALFTVWHKPVALASTPVFQFPQSDAFNKQTNTTNAALLINLEDKSVVQLQPGATLSYPKQFKNNRREVYLDGGASFNITKNAARPFLVYTGTIVTQVLGTSFTVKKWGNRFEVAVLSGKVAVYEEGNKQLHNKGGVVITPNEKVTYYSDDHHFITSLVDNPVALQKSGDSVVTKEPFLFDETPVANVVNKLEERYAVQIITENDKINHCLFSGNISGQSLYHMLDMICGAIGANYEIRGTSIILTGNGCD